MKSRRATNSRKEVDIRDLIALTTKMQSMKVNMKNARRGKQGKTAPKTMSTNIPYAQAVKIRQTTADRVQRISGSDIIGSLVLTSATTSGALQTYIVAPWNFPNTRQFTLSRNFQKFRYRRLRFTLASNQPSTVGGTVVMGYTSNPDQSFSSGPSNINEVFNLPSAELVNMFLPTSITAKLQDPNKWYNIDPDSSELMQTAQGLFALTVQTTINITGSTSIPILMDYEIEFAGTAVQNYSSSVVQIFPAGTWTATDQTTWTFATNSGEPAVPPLFASGQVTSSPYVISPYLILKVGDGPEQTLRYFIASTVTGTGVVSYRFFPNVEAIETQNPYKNPASTTFQSLRTTVEVLSSN
jgi:hypothetical protein